jgi:hypothetical protein
VQSASEYLHEVVLIILIIPAELSRHHHHHQITKLSHSINAIGPAPHRGGRNREHCSSFRVWWPPLLI